VPCQVDDCESLAPEVGALTLPASSDWAISPPRPSRLVREPTEGTIRLASIGTGVLGCIAAAVVTGALWGTAAGVDTHLKAIMLPMSKTIRYREVFESARTVKKIVRALIAAFTGAALVYSSLHKFALSRLRESA
jgi:hypothetical protein